MSKNNKKKLPKKLIVIQNADKKWHERWDNGRDELNIPHPFRWALIGPPNVGKSTIVRNILMRANPKFDKVFVIHCDPDTTNEYKDVDARMLHHIPSPDWWETCPPEDLEEKKEKKTKKGKKKGKGKKCEIEVQPIPKSLSDFQKIIDEWNVNAPKKNKNGKIVKEKKVSEQKKLVIIDDYEFSGMSKQQKSNMDRLFGYVSTHKNCSVILCNQSFYTVPVNIRRFVNGMVIWKTPDRMSIKTMAQKCFIDPKLFQKIFKEHLPGFRDSLWIDHTHQTPYPLRKNGYEMLSIEPDSDSDSD